MTQEFVTLPREIVEQALEALLNEGNFRKLRKPLIEESIKQIKAALEQPQNHVPDVGNMVQAGWMPVPVEPTEAMLDAGCEAVDGPDWTGSNAVYRAMLAAAPQPPTTEQSSVVQQPQVEQEPVAWIIPSALEWRTRESAKVVEMTRIAQPEYDFTEPLYTHPQLQRELTKEEARRIYNAATYHASLAIFMTRMDAEHPDADDKGVSGWLQEAEDRVKRRITEAAHNIK